MEDLIEALTIFLKYKNIEYPTNCEHDVLYIMEVAPEEVSAADCKRLAQLDFIIDENFEYFYSHRFGSA